MPLLATYTYTSGLVSLAAGVNCFAHGLPTTPDWTILTTGLGYGSIPHHLVSRTSRAVIYQNSNGAGEAGSDGVTAETVAQFVHSLAR